MEGNREEREGAGAAATKPQLERNQAVLFPPLPKSQERAAFPPAVVVLAPAHTEITGNKKFSPDNKRGRQTGACERTDVLRVYSPSRLCSRSDVSHMHNV